MRRLLIIGGLFGLSLAAGTSQADPLTTLLGLAAADRATRAGSVDAPHTPWRQRLTVPQRQALQSMRHHPAIKACVIAADADNAVASYHLRKIAQFGVSLRREATQRGAFPEVTTLDYAWPARAFRWCEHRAGEGVQAKNGTLESHARRIARLVAGTTRQDSLTAYQTP